MKRYLLIGARGGIGNALANRLSGEAVELVLHARSCDGLGNSKEIAIGDLVDWANDPNEIPDINPVDGIIWCAGVCDLHAGQMLTKKSLRRTFSVNLEAPLIVLSYMYRKGIIKDGGKIILLGSQAAHDAGEGFSVYAASKGGLAAAARVLDKEFSRRDVTVTCLEPETVNTPMTQKIIQQFGGLKGGHMDSMVEPDEIAERILKLLSN